MADNLPCSVGFVNRYRYAHFHTIPGMAQLTLSGILAENVKNHMAKRQLGTSADALRKETGVGQGVADNVLKGDGDSRLSTVEKMARKFRVPPWQMLLPNIETPEEFGLSIPRLENAARMGKGAGLLESDSVVERITVSKPWVQAHIPGTTNPANLRVITAFGDSMEPTLKDGDFTLVDTAVRSLDRDGIYVLMDPKEGLYIKRVSRIKRGTKIELVVTSDNPSAPPFGTPEGLTTVGKVVWAWNGKKL